MPPMGRRLRSLTRDELDDRQRALYDSVTGGPRASGPGRFPLVDGDGGLIGPFNAFLLEPAVGDRLQALGAVLRFDTSFTDRAREIAILTVATHHDATFERYAHERIGRRAGLTDVELAALRAGDLTVWTDPGDRVVAETAGELLATGDLGDDSYERAIAQLGESGLFELTTLVGYYALLAVQLRIFRVPTPDD